MKMQCLRRKQAKKNENYLLKNLVDKKKSSYFAACLVKPSKFAN